jgi:hypothetical protein
MYSHRNIHQLDIPDGKTQWSNWLFIDRQDSGTQVYLMTSHLGQQIVIVTTIWWWQKLGRD